jgi:ABC-type antimicrobial peptide transport system permease subunit
MSEERKRADPMFLIIAGAITALFLPFAIAYPPTLIAKAGAVALLVIVAAAISALVRRLRK